MIIAPWSSGRFVAAETPPTVYVPQPAVEAVATAVAASSAAVPPATTLYLTAFTIAELT